MKTSNYILIAFAAFMVVSIMVFAADAVKHKEDTGTIYHNQINEEIPVISTLVIETKQPIDIYDREYNRIEVFNFWYTDSVQFDLHRVSNDTLFIYGELPHSNQAIVVSLSAIQSLVGMPDSRIHFKDKGQYPDLSQITLNGSSLRFDGEGVFNEVKINTYNSQVFNSKALIDRLDMTLHNSVFRTEMPVSLYEGLKKKDYTIKSDQSEAVFAIQAGQEYEVDVAIIKQRNKRGELN